MRRHPLRQVVPGLLLCGLLCGLAAPARAALTMELSSAKARYLQDEFLYVTVAFRNAGSQDAPLVGLLEPGMGVLEFEITTPDGETHRHVGQFQATLAEGALDSSIIWLMPAGEYTVSVDLTFEMGDAPGTREPPVLTVLRTPGEYVLRACYEVPEGSFVGPATEWSNELRVTVVEPTGDDLAVYSILQGAPRTSDQSIWNCYQEQAEYYECILREYPESSYAPYVRLMLGGIYNLQGSHFQRGTPEGREALARAADLELAAARDAVDGHFVLRATLAATGRLAALGRPAEAQALLEDAFTWDSTTDSDKTRLLAWMNHIETGFFQRSSGVVADTAAVPASVPLRALAQALGFSVQWDSSTKDVTVTTPRVAARLQPGDDTITVNGTRRRGARVSLTGGQTRVSPSVIATLMAEHYGEGMANAFPQMVLRDSSNAQDRGQ